MKQKLLAAALLATLGLSASAYADNALDTLSNEGGFTTMLKVIKNAGLEDSLKAAGPITVFAPTDEAFAKLPKGKLDALMKDHEALKKLVEHHIVNSKITKTEVDAGKVATMDGSTVKLSVSEGVKIDNIPVAGSGISADNGVIHPMSGVLMTN